MTRKRFIKIIIRSALIIILGIVAWIAGRKAVKGSECTQCPLKDGCDGNYYVSCEKK